MEIKKVFDNNKATISISGWLDTQTAPEFKDVIEKLTDDITELVIDCEELEYVSSAGLRQLVAAHTKMKGNLELNNVSDEIMYVLKTTGLDKVINIK